MNEHMEFLRKVSRQAKDGPDATQQYGGKAEKPPVWSNAPSGEAHVHTQENSCWIPQIHGQNEVECFGGRLFRSEDKNRQPVIRFVTDRMDADQVQEAEEWYNLLGRMKQCCFLHRTTTHPTWVGRYVTFDFEITDQVFSLGELHRQGIMNRKEPVMILRKLNDLIIQYRAGLASKGEKYRALNCLTVETVFFDMDNNIQVLPVVACGNKYPIEIPREVLTEGQRTDEKSDLYAAAYVAVEASSESISDWGIQKPNSEVILACLQPVRDWRPDPDEVYQLVRGQRSKPRTKVGGVPRGRQFEMDWLEKLWNRCKKWREELPVFEEAEEEDQMDETNEPGNSFRSGWRRNIPRNESGGDSRFMSRKKKRLDDDSWDGRD